MTAQIEEEHTDEHQDEVDRLALQILFVEEEGAEEEGDYHTATTHHRDNGNHGILVAEGVEIDEIGCAEKQRDAHNGPLPAEGRARLALRIPQEQDDGAHDEHLVDVVPRLHQHGMEPRHQVLVVQAADGARHRRQDDEQNPLVVFEIDALLLTRTAQHKERKHGQQHANPLVEVQPLAKHQQGANKHHDGTRGIDGANDGERQVLHAEVAEYPRRKNDERLQQDVLVRLPARYGHVEHRPTEHVGRPKGQQDERKEHQTGENGIQKQNRQHGIVAQRLFLESIIKSQQRSREKSKK